MESPLTVDYMYIVTICRCLVVQRLCWPSPLSSFVVGNKLSSDTARTLLAYFAINFSLLIFQCFSKCFPIFSFPTFFQLFVFLQPCQLFSTSSIFEYSSTFVSLSSTFFSWSTFSDFFLSFAFFFCNPFFCSFSINSFPAPLQSFLRFQTICKTFSFSFFCNFSVFFNFFLSKFLKAFSQLFSQLFFQHSFMLLFQTSFMSFFKPFFVQFSHFSIVKNFEFSTFFSNPFLNFFSRFSFFFDFSIFQFFSFSFFQLFFNFLSTFFNLLLTCCHLSSFSTTETRTFKFSWKGK